MTLRDEIIEVLIKEHISSPRLEADIILKNAAPNYPNITEVEKKKIEEMLKRRLKHEPLDKIIGYKEFYKYTFKVNQDVLSPRPDTEILVESALELIKEEKFYQILDLGTGSGCILLSLLKEKSTALGTGLDKSAAALKIAKQNAQELDIEDRVEFINKSWNDINFEHKKFDIIVSNPPYIESKEIRTLDKEVKDYDPMLALDGGKDGLNCYRDIAMHAPKWLKSHGYILLEVGYNQADQVRQIFENHGLKFIKTAKDLAGIDRCVILKNSFHELF